MTTLAETTTAEQPSRESDPSIYLTDGLRLFRVVRGFAWPPEESYAVLEDCRTLENRPYSSDELSIMGLSLVRASASSPAQ